MNLVARIGVKVTRAMIAGEIRAKLSELATKLQTSYRTHFQFELTSFDIHLGLLSLHFERKDALNSNEST